MSARPNVLLVVTDQQRGDMVGAAGKLPVRTPAADRLCAEPPNHQHRGEAENRIEREGQDDRPRERRHFRAHAFDRGQFDLGARLPRGPLVR